MFWRGPGYGGPMMVINRNDPQNEWWSDEVISLPTANWKHLCMVGSQIWQFRSYLLNKAGCWRNVKSRLGDGISCAEMGESKELLREPCSSFVHHPHFGAPSSLSFWRLNVDWFFFNKTYQLFIQHPPWPRILFPSLLSRPCGRSMPRAAGQGAAGQEAEDAGGLGGVWRRVGQS